MASQRSITAGQAAVRFFLDDGPLQRGLKQAERRISRFGASLRANGAAILGIGAVFATPFLASIKAASDLEEQMNKFNVVFGDNAAAVKQWGDEFAGQVGRSKRQIAEFLAGTQDLLVPIGFEPGAAEQYSKQLTGLAIDVASFNNKADADVLRDFHAALTGGGETVKKYGVVLNVATTNAELLNQGIDPKRATETEKAFARMQVILKGTTAAQGDAIRSGGSFANQMKRLQGVTEDAAAAIGNVLLPAVTPVVSRIADMAGWLETVVMRNEEFVATIAKTIGAVIAVGAAMVVAGLAIQGLAIALGGFGKVLSLVVGGFSFLKTAIASSIGLFSALLSPVGILIALLGGLAGYALVASGAINRLSEFLGGRLGKAWNTIVGLIGSGNLKAAGNLAMAGLKAVFAVGLGEIEGFWVRFKGALATTFLDLTATLENAWISFVGFFQDSFMRAVAYVRSAFQSFTNSTAEVIATAIAKATGQDVDEVLETLREDQDRGNRDFVGEAEQQIEQRRAERQAQQTANREQADAAIAEVDRMTEDAAASAAANVDQAAAEFDAAQDTATGILDKEAADDQGEAADDIASAMQNFVKGLQGGGDAVARANEGVDIRSRQGQDAIAMALTGAAQDDGTIRAIASQTVVLRKELEDLNNKLKNGKALKAADA